MEFQVKPSVVCLVSWLNFMVELTLPLSDVIIWHDFIIPQGGELFVEDIMRALFAVHFKILSFVYQFSVSFILFPSKSYFFIILR